MKEPLLASIHTLSQKHSIPFGTIWQWYYDEKSTSSHNGISTLTEEQEEQLLYAVQAVSAVNLDWEIAQLQEATRVMFGVKMSQAAAYRFKEKHSDIFSFEQPKSLGKKQ